MVGAVITTIAAVATWAITQFILERKRARERRERAILDKRIAAYGTILTMLQVFEERAKAHPQAKNGNNIPHLFHQFDEYEGLRKAIGRSRHLLSHNVTETWINSMSKFRFDTKRDLGGESYFYEDLSALQKMVAEEYAELKEQYQGTTQSRHMTKYSAGRVTMYVTVILAAGFMTFLIFGGAFDSLIFTHPQIYGDFIGNPLNPKEKLFIQIILHSTTYSANIPMPADVFIALDGNYRNWNDFETNTTDTFHVLFLGTYCGEIRPKEAVRICSLELPRHPTDERLFYNTTTLTYSRGDQFDVKLNAVGNSTEQMVGHGFIGISSTEALNTYNTFKMSFFIGVVAVAFAALSLYEQGANKSGKSNNHH